MFGKPPPHRLGKPRCQVDMPIRHRLRTRLLLFANTDDSTAEVEVFDSRTEDLATSGSCVRDECKHRIYERVPCRPLDVIKQFRHLACIEEQTGPNRLPFFLRQSASHNDVLDLPECHEWRLFVGLRESHALDWRSTGKFASLDSPVPDQPEGRQFLADRVGTDQPPVPLLPRPRIRVPLEVGYGK